MSETLVTYYGKHKISPVKLDLPSLERHFQNRAALFHHLGLIPSLFKGKKIIEFGPGSGQNSLFTTSQKPERYVFVEGNPTAIEDIKACYSQYPEFEKFIHIEHSLFQNFCSDELFDAVFCERALLGKNKTVPILKHISSFVAPGGVLVITCSDHVACLAEFLRRLMAQSLLNPNASMDSQVEMLTPIFSSHLVTLNGMNRKPDHWIIDNLLNPVTISQTFPIPDAVNALSKDFDFFSTSPRFCTDWRWHKDISENSKSFNQVLIDSYWDNLHNFLDYRNVSPSRTKSSNQVLSKLAIGIQENIIQFENTRDPIFINEVKDLLDVLITHIDEFSPITAQSLKEACKILSKIPINPKAIAESKYFKGLFGRGTQHLSFTRKA